MKKNIVYIIIAVMVHAIGFVACQPDDFELGSAISKDELNYSITQDAEDPNMIILESFTPGLTPLWQTPMGRSTNVKDTVRLPFAGDYQFIYGVESAGGYIQADTFNLTLTTNNLMYVDDPLWTMLSGGVGNSKTWLLDLNADGVSKYWKGPMYFSSDTWRWGNIPAEGTEGWIWEADWAGNGWIAEAHDYGTMTFDLIGGANVLVEHMNSPGRGTENGVYFLDADAKTLKMTDAAPLMNNYVDGANIDDWSLGYVISLTDDAMQIGYKDKAKSEFIIFNYISKEYSDNWVPKDLPDPEPVLPDGWKDDVSETTITAIKWVLSPETPFNWANLDGSLMNTEWVSADTYPDWTGMNADVPATYADFSLTLNSDDNSAVLVLPDGTESTGSYDLDDKGIYTFTGIKPEFNICSWVNLSTTAENQWRILSIEKNTSGAISGMWVGALSTEKPEYMCYKLVPQAGEGGSSEPEGTVIAFDNSKLDFGDLEGNDNLRLELYSDFGSTKDDSGINTSDLVFSNRIDVTFTLGGITLIDGAVGSYSTSMYYADADWDPNGNGNVITVTGDGTYTVSYTPGSDVDGAVVFVIDIVDMGKDISDMSAVTATIDNVVLY